jgi:hypothetical protein
MATKTKTNIKGLGKKYRFTPDGLFAIEPNLNPGFVTAEQNDSKYLYIKTDKIDEILNSNSALSNLIKNEFIVLDILEKTKKLKMVVSGLDMEYTYNKYIFHRPLIDKRKYSKKGVVNSNDKSLNENDCLKFGECMTVMSQKPDMNRFNTMIQSDTSPPVLQYSSLKNKQFGESDELNIELLSKIPESKKNNNAIPENGESYAIVRSEIVEKSAPYHIAFVLYRHDNINITLEASADAGNEYYPRFGFYDTNSDGLTFHNLFSKHYTNGETVVLKRRNIDTVLNEIDKEISEKNAEKNEEPSSKKRKITGGKKKISNKKKISKKRKSSKKRKTVKTMRFYK